MSKPKIPAAKATTKKTPATAKRKLSPEAAARVMRKATAILGA